MYPSTSTAQTRDTLSGSHALFTARDLLLIGGFVAGATAVRPFDIGLAHDLRGQRPQSSGILHAAATGFRLFGNPGAFGTGAALYVIGRVDGQRRTEDLGLHAFEAEVLTHLAVGAVKVVAALTGVSRMYTNDHWASDVIIGAAIGTIVGIKTFKYTHSHPDNWVDRKLLHAGVQIGNDRSLSPILAVVRR